MENDIGPQQFKEIWAKKQIIKPPAYPWQEFALHIIDDLGVPRAKRNSVFQVCKKYPRAFIEKCVNDTKELCTDGEPWRYFFKLTSAATTKKSSENQS